MGQPSIQTALLATLTSLATLAPVSAAEHAQNIQLRLTPTDVFNSPADSATWNSSLVKNVSLIAESPDHTGHIYNPTPTRKILPESAPEDANLPSLMLQHQPASEPTNNHGTHLPPNTRQPSANQPHISFGRGAHATDGWQVLPEGLLYRSYLAGDKEPRMQFLALHDSVSGRQVWDATLGGRVGLLRNGSVGGENPQGFQIDLDGGVFARVLPEEPSAMLEGSDYRAGLTGSWREDNTAWRLGYSHISSHIGDEFLLAYPNTPRPNYVRDSLLAGLSHDLSESLRLYGEIAWAAGASGGAEPLELQAGSEWTPEAKSRWSGAPFLAVHGHYREEQGSLIGVNTAAGWNWRGIRSGHRLKLGANYYHGPSLQYSFLDRRESLLGGGIWLDF